MSGGRALRFKMFRALGGSDEHLMEAAINKWLAAAHARGVDVIRTETALCSVGGAEDIYQHVVISVWYSEPSARDAAG